MNITLKGVDVRYELDGPVDDDSAPWILFSNSLTTDVTMWNGEVAQLADRFRMLRYDTRGHGQTSAPDGPYSFDLLVSDVVALMDAVGVETAHFVGLSLGGMIGLGAAIRHPERILSLASCDARVLGGIAGHYFCIVVIDVSKTREALACARTSTHSPDIQLTAISSKITIIRARARFTAI